MIPLPLQCAKDSHHVDGMDVVGESVMSIEALFLLLSDGGAGGGAKAVRANLGPLKECLQCVVRLCRVQPEACDQFVDIIGGMLLQTGEKLRCMFDPVRCSVYQPTRRRCPTFYDQI